jgi:hypothetical protein
VWHPLDDPFGFRVWSRLPPTCIWILDELLTVPNQSANIKLVIEKSRAAPPVTVDCRRSPVLAGGTRNVLPVKGAGDRSWRAAFCELFEDPADYRGFNLIDAALAVNGLAGRIDTVNNVIAEA